MDGDGIWNACTMNVITNTAITTVPSNDGNEPVTPVSAAHAGRSFGIRSSGRSASGNCSSGEFIYSIGPATIFVLLIRGPRSLCQPGSHRLRPRSQIRQQLPRCVLLRCFLGGALRSSYKFRPAFAVLCAQSYFDGECLTVFWSRFLHQDIRRLRHS